MAPDERKEQGPHRHYEDLRVVADTEEYPEHLVIGVIIDGAFLPIVHHPLGFVESVKGRWNELGGVKVKSMPEEAMQGVETRLANLERAAIAAGMQLDAPAQPLPPATDE